ncbi:hypothetical protein CIL03_00045 [Virgibacillus indicus]|uniref:NERD domain-containing protein n=1 Tax=Virgibacillus indicus TaxID=2024554 RepID=A0A265NC32_9BACI|nr:hypothetical protein [Virgibacillus indicus]OZU89578.1 hypothetical protein CIL03_00045 [Virgibacillus indicus]
MAQLIKLRDYISRYEWNTYRYPSQYIRLKQDNWKKLHYIWSHPEEKAEEEMQPEEKVSRFSKVKSFLKKEKEQEDEDTSTKENVLPDTEKELKQYFLDKILRFQLKWATSTVTDTSFMNKSYYQDPLLKYFLQRFPDIYLIMYYPVFNIKKAPVDGEIILISPVGIEIIHLLEDNPEAVIMAGDDRTWTLEIDSHHTKILSPLISLKRTEQIVRSILNSADVDYSIKKTVLSRKNNIVFSNEPYNTSIIGKKNYEDWFHTKRKLQSPLKSNQLKAAEALLKHCQTTSVKRPEWEEDTNDFSFSEEG